MGQSPIVNPQLAAILKDRIISMDLILELSKFVHDQRNLGFAAGYVHGVEHTSNKISKVLEELNK